MIIRPGAVTANAPILDQARQVSTRLLMLSWAMRVRITHADFNAAAGSESLNLRTLMTGRDPFPEDIKAGEYFFDLVQHFAGGVLNSATAELGVSGDTDDYIDSLDVFTGSDLGWRLVKGDEWAPDIFPAATFEPLITVATGNGNVSTLTSGILDVYIPFEYLPAHRGA